MRPGKGYGREKNERAVAHTGTPQFVYVPVGQDAMDFDRAKRVFF